MYAHNIGNDDNLATVMVVIDAMSATAGVKSQAAYFQNICEKWRNQKV